MPRSRINLTDAFIRSFPAPEARTDVWDDKVRGLVLRVTPAGVKTWTVVYSRQSDGARQRATLGRYPGISLEQARKLALKAMSAVAEGDDPADKRRTGRAALTVKQLGAVYIDKYAKRHKRTWEEDERILNKDVYPKIGRMKGTSVKRRDILDIIEEKAEAGKTAAAVNVLAVVRKFFNWLVANDYIQTSPVAGVKPPAKPTRRDRVLSEREIEQVWVAIYNAGISDDVKEILRLLLLLGQRSGEVCGMTVAEVELSTEMWTIPKSRTKNGLEHTVPLPPMALKIVE
ncbi:MAG TPA: integrase arm-type DNA-binding domain-containing protein, partial [Rhizobiaceae bacterium]|nr:integrase arm-type DNA-binding domain-containing protein [Rhizobiaceae bacterium]